MAEVLSLIDTLTENSSSEDFCTAFNGLIHRNGSSETYAAAAEKVKAVWAAKQLKQQADYAKHLSDATNRLTCATIGLVIVTALLVVATRWNC
jgi:hypothetical protein